MRLTLRTLLAYLDESLEPADATEIGKKIEASEFASDLVQRIRGTMSRPRLGAPKLFGKGLALDPNSVAEYLDSVLPPDRVGEFEKICLESDVHLAEAGACHQILTLVFIEPAPTELVSRDGIYRLKELADSQRAVAIDELVGPPLVAAAEPPAIRPLDSAPPVTAEAMIPGKAAPGKNGVRARKVSQPRVTEHFVGAPLASDSLASDAGDFSAADYGLDGGLEDGVSPKRRRYSDATDANERSVWPVIAMLAAGFFIALLGLRAMGEFDSSHPLVKLFDGETVTNQPLASSTPDNEKSVASSDRTSNKKPAPASSGSRRRGDSSRAADDSSSVSGAAVSEGGASEGAVSEDASDTASDALSDAAVAAAPANSIPDATLESASGDLAATLREDASGDKALGGETSGEDSGEAVETDEVAPPPLLMGVELGLAAADKQLLVRYDEGAANWLRVADATAIRSGDHLVALPLYRPALLLNSGLAIELIGPASCRIDARAGGAKPASSLFPAASAAPTSTVPASENPSASADGLKEDGSPEAALPEAPVTDSPVTESPVTESPTIGAPVVAAPPTFAGATRFTLSDGSAFITTPADQPEAGGPLQVNLAGRTGWLVFANVDSRAAISVKHAFVPGADPEKEAAPLLVEVYALAGALQWLPIADGFSSGPPGAESASLAEAIVVNPGEKLVFENILPGRIEPAPLPPEWILPPDPRDLDQQTAATLEGLIPSDRSAVLSLLEQVGYRQVEVGSLATRSLGYLDQFEPFIDTLGRDDQKAFWDQQIASLREALARGPETARLVRQTFERRRMDDAAKLFRFLRGYNAVQLSAPAEVDGSGEISGAAELVRGLENDDLDVRVLAIKNLTDITGMTQSYRPEISLARRQTYTKRWRTSLEAGQIQYPAPPKPPVGRGASGGKTPGSTPPKAP